MSRIYFAIIFCLTFPALLIDAQSKSGGSKSLSSKRSNKSNVRRQSRLPAGVQLMCDPTPYPPIPRSEQAKDSVTVRVLIDEEGNVISARAVSGDPKLRQKAVNAALKAKFTPTKLSGKPVKTSGMVTYKFVEQE